MIAVTGATGFLGAHLVCTFLQNGTPVKALKRPNSSLQEFNYIALQVFNINPKTPLLTWADADVLDVPALEQALKYATEVYHCAAMVSFHKKDRAQLMQVNVEGTANVVNVCLQLGIKKLAHISSIAALGREKSGIEVTEQTKWVNSKLNSNYAISKYKAELEAWRGHEEGLPTVIVNPGVILGAGNWQKGTCALFNMVNKGMPFYTEGVNGYVDVKDVALATIQLMQQNKFGQRYILVSESWSMRSFLNQTAGLLNKKQPFIRVTPLLAEVAWVAAWLKAFVTGTKANLTKETSRASLKKYHYSNQKIKDAIGYTFIPLSNTITHACLLFKNNPYT